MYSINEPFHWKEALATGLSFLLGIGLIVSSFQNVGDVYEDVGLVVGGLAILIVSIAAFQITDGWKHANNLPTGKKIIAYLPVLITGIALIVLLFFLWIVKEAAKDSFKQK